MGIQKGDIRIDPLLTEISIQYKNTGGYIADKVLPIAKIATSQAKYLVYGKGMKYIANSDYEHGRQAHAKYNKIDFSMATPVTVSTVVYGWEAEIDDDEREDQQDPIELDTDYTETLTETAAIARERRATTLAFTSTNFTNTAAAATVWDNAASDPINETLGMKQTILSSSGVKPNKMIVGHEVHRYLLNHQDIIDRLKYVARATEAEINLALADMFGVDEYIVGSAQYNTANEGQDASLSAIWGKSCLIAYINNKPTRRSVSLGYTLSKEPLATSKYRKQEVDSDVIRVREKCKEVLTAELCGYLLTSVVT